MARPEPPNEPIASIELDTPITAWGESLDRLDYYRRPTAGDLEWLQDSGFKGVKGTLHIVQRLTLVPVASLRRLDAWDYAKAEDVVNRFLGNGPTTINGE
jgi:hypothetical protein